MNLGGQPGTRGRVLHGGDHGGEAGGDPAGHHDADGVAARALQGACLGIGSVPSPSRRRGPKYVCGWWWPPPGCPPVHGRRWR